MSAIAIFAVLFLIVFIAGTLIGIFLIVCWASNREDRRKTIKGPPPGNGTGGVRHLTGVGRRDSTLDRSTERSDPDRGQGRWKDQ
jgi:hypothetical protein